MGNRVINFGCKKNVFLIFLFSIFILTVNVSASVFDEGLISYYNFDNNFNDSFGVKNGVGYGVVGFEYGKSNDSVNFGSFDDYVLAEHMISTTDNTSFSISFWVYQDDVDTDKCIVSQHNASRDTGFRFCFDWYGKIMFDTGKNSYLSDATSSAGVWKLAVASYDGNGSLDLYINNEKTSFSGVQFFEDFDNLLKIGMMSQDTRNYYNNWSNGDVDELAFWNRSLSEAEVDELWNNGSGVFYNIDETEVQMSILVNLPLNLNYSVGEIIFDITAMGDNEIDSCLYSLNGGVDVLMNMSEYELGDYAGESFYLGDNIGFPYGFDSDGTYFFVMDDDSYMVHKYWLNGTYTGENFDVSVDGEYEPYGIVVEESYFLVTAYNYNNDSLEILKYWLNGTYVGEGSNIYLENDHVDLADIDWFGGIAKNDMYFFLISEDAGGVFKYWLNGSYTGDFFEIEGLKSDVHISIYGEYLFASSWGDEVYRYWLNGTDTGEGFVVESEVVGGGYQVALSGGVSVVGDFVWVIDYFTNTAFKYHVRDAVVGDYSDSLFLESGLYSVQFICEDVEGNVVSEVVEFEIEADVSLSFDFLIETVSANQVFSFQTDNTVNLTVKWGDGSEDVYEGTGLRSHVYSDVGNYTVSLNGTASRIAFGGWSGETPSLFRDILTPVSDGVVGINSSRNMFRDAIGIDIFTSEDFFDEVSEDVMDMRYMFSGAINFDGNISGWNVSNVKYMGYMFHNAHNFDQDIGSWDVSGVMKIQSMFDKAYSFNQDIGAWNVSSVWNAGFVFADAYSFNQDIGAWDVSNAHSMDYMFYNASSFNQDISSWDVSMVENMEWMFFGAINFNSNISNWNVLEVQMMDYMFYDAWSFNGDIGSWNVSGVHSMHYMFYNARNFNQDISNWDVSMVGDMTDMFWNVTLSIENYDLLLIGWSNLSSLKSSVNFSGGNSQYSIAGNSSRQSLIDNYGWIIVDGGLI